MIQESVPQMRPQPHRRARQVQLAWRAIMMSSLSPGHPQRRGSNVLDFAEALTHWTTQTFYHATGESANGTYSFLGITQFPTDWTYAGNESAECASASTFVEGELMELFHGMRPAPPSARTSSATCSPPAPTAPRSRSTLAGLAASCTRAPKSPGRCISIGCERQQPCDPGPWVHPPPGAPGPATGQTESN
jgi:hypothetical protein